MSVGQLTRVTTGTYTLPAGCAPYGICSSPDSNNVYVVSGGSTTTGIVQLAVNQADGTLGQIGSQPLVVTTNAGARRAVVTPDGKHLYATITGYDKVAMFVRSQTDGSLSGRVDYTASVTNPQFLCVSNDNDHVYVANYNSGGVSGNVQVYLRDKTTGALTLKQTYALQNAFGIAISKDGKGIYVSLFNGSLKALNRDTNPASGTYGQILSVAGTYTLPTASNNAVAVTDDNLFVYVLSDTGAQYTEGFARNTSDNTLTSIGHPPATSDNQAGNWDIALSNDANQTSLYSAISDGQEIAQYTRNVSTGALTAMSPGSAKMSNYVSEPGTGSAGPYGVTVLKNNKYLYATTTTSANTVDVFSIEQSAAPSVSSVAVSPSSATLNGGTTQQFSATVNGANSPSQSVTWSTTAGSINSSGLLTAPAATGSIQSVTVTATSVFDNTKSGTATVTVPAAVATTASITLVNTSNVPWASLTGVSWALFDQTGTASLGAPSVKGSTGTTDANGVMTLNITGTTLAPGANGTLLVTHGTKAFCGVIGVS